MEEFHGPYGPYAVSELVLQRVWLEGAFAVERMVDHLGRVVVVRSPGRWNRLEGPDFIGAVLMIDGELVCGDVEVHFAQSDWRAHGHHMDERYDRVVLHVVYHELKRGEGAISTRSGRMAPSVSLLPLLWYSLEEYASEDSIIASSGVELGPGVESYLELTASERASRLVEAARRRWEMKRHYAGLRVARLGWEAACHQTALEIMGYSKNRIPMLVLAEAHPLADWATGGLELESLWARGEGRWRVSGTRPANHPRGRIAQYAAWAKARPNWPELLRGMRAEWERACGVKVAAEDWGRVAAGKRLVLQALAWALDERVLGHEVGGPKRNTLVCDGCLPLLGALWGDLDFFELWFHWPVGNAPEACLAALRQLGVVASRRAPPTNGWLQAGLAELREGSA